MRTPDGRLWFVNGRILQMLDPNNRHTNPFRRRCTSSRSLRIGRPICRAQSVALPALTSDIQIDYAGLSFVAPQKVRFRYKLEGRDTDWQDPGTRRQAFYSDLPPGQYRFHVIACNNDGLWNETGATLDFVVPPAIYQTVWFKILLLLSGTQLSYGSCFVFAFASSRQRSSRAWQNDWANANASRANSTTLFSRASTGLLLRFQVVNQLIPKNEKAHEIMEDAMNRADQLMSESRERIRNLRRETGAIAALPEALSAIGEEAARENDRFPAGR